VSDRSIQGLDPVAHGRVRLGVLAFLSSQGVGDFSELARALEVGNALLSSHLKRLEEAGYVTLERGFLGRRPRMQVRLTPEGAAAWDAHLAHLERIVRRPSD
jgi:DNA-binding MarR family transcriptional regulator